MAKPILWTLRFSLIFLFAMTPLLSAQDFRIETELYVGDANKSSSRNVTVFSDSLVYDFLMSDTQQLRSPFK